MGIEIEFRNRRAASKFRRAMAKRGFRHESVRDLVWYTDLTEYTEAALNTLAEDMDRGDVVSERTW